MNETIGQYHERLESVCPRGNLMTWKRIKTVLFASIAGAAYWISLMFGSDPTQSFLIFMGTLIVIYYAFEAEEIRFAGLLTVFLDNINNGDDE